jgi:hypothetical protein
MIACNVNDGPRIESHPGRERHSEIGREPLGVQQQGSD